MGMYTDFCFDAKLKKNTPTEIIELLKNWQDWDWNPAVLPAHPFFSLSSWRCIGSDMSYYFDGPGYFNCTFDEIANSYYLQVRGNLKNYESEIETFIEWITPYLNKTPGEFLGFYRYEEYDEPTLVYMSEQ